MPMIAVLITSRANAIPYPAERVPVILLAWEAGMYVGEAVVRTILGEKSPSGRLPISLPRSSGHLRCNYDHPRSVCPVTGIPRRRPSTL